MRRAGIALAVLLAALLGFGAGSAGTFFVGVSASVSSECDGVCFSKLDEVIYAALGAGVVCAILFALVAWRLGSRYFVKPS